MALVSITRLRVRSWWYIFGFFVKVLCAALQAKSADGSAAVLLLSEHKNTYWTCTVWKDEASMRSFMSSGAHRHAMPKLLEWCDEASVLHWFQDSEQVPSWNEAHQRMQSQGRRSKVNHPSEAHLAYQIPFPQVKRTRVLRFK